MSRAVCPGSFDPVTNGHLDVIERTTRWATEVIVAVGNNMGKNALFPPSERVAMLREATAAWPTVEVALFDGLLVDFCTTRGIGLISKGLRAADFGYELPMAQMNHRLSGIDTIFMPTAPQWAYVSSSLVREIAVLGGDVSAFVPEPVQRRLAQRAASIGSGGPG